MENSQAERGSRGPVIHSFPAVLEYGVGEETGVDYTLKCGNIVALRLSELARYMSHLSQQMGRKGTQLPWHPCCSVVDGLSWWWTSTAMVWHEVPLKNQYSVLSLSTACPNYSLLFSALVSLTVNWRWTLHHRIIEKCRWDECGLQSPRAQDLTK